MTLPVGWREVTVEEWMEDLQTLPEGASLGNQDFVARLESGQVLTTAEGFTDLAVNVQVEVSMARGATTMRDAMTSVSEDLAQTGGVENTETGTISAPIGTAISVRYVIKLTGDSDTALPAHVMAYAVPLGSDGTLVIHSFGVQSDSSHRAMLDNMISTLRVSDGLPPQNPSRRWAGQVEGTDLRFVYPETFVPVPIDGLRDSLADHIKNGTPGAGPEAQRTVDAIDAKVLRAQLSSQKPLGVGRILRIMVHREIDDLDSAIQRILDEFGDPEVLSREEVELPIGHSVRLQLTVPEARIPAIDDVFAVLLDDGMSLTITGRAGRTDVDFEAIVLEFAESFAHN